MRTKREKGPKNGVIGSPSKTSKKSTSTKASSATSPTKVGKKDGMKKPKIKGETSFIIEELMNQGIAKGDITMSDGTGTDNMTCIIVYFRDPEDVKLELQQKEEQKNSN